MSRSGPRPWQLMPSVLLLLLLANTKAAAQCTYQLLEGDGIPGVSQAWSYNGTVWAVASADEPDGPAVYLGGSFTRAGTVLTNNIVKWKPLTNSWLALGAGMGGLGAGADSVSALIELGGQVYVGGYHSTQAGEIAVNAIARWDPATQAWAALGEGLRDAFSAGSVSSFAVLDSKLYVGGFFATAGSVSTSGVACWDPVMETWSGLNGGVNGGVNGMAVIDGRLYAAGWFTSAGGVPANRAASWDPTTQTWSPLGTGFSGYDTRVQSVAALDGKLYVGGAFSEAGGVPVRGIACWDPATQTWSALGEATEYFQLIGVADSHLYGKAFRDNYPT